MIKQLLLFETIKKKAVKLNLSKNLKRRNGAKILNKLLAA